MGRESPGLKLQCKGIVFEKILRQEIILPQGLQGLNNHITTKDKEMCSENAILPKKILLQVPQGLSQAQ